MAAALAREALVGRLREACAQRCRWDVVVVGGGATGLGCALDATSRGYATLLLEARDFAKGTSSRATKLIHGGVRYLAQGNLALVREALDERAVLLANAPHLVRPLRFVVPLYRWHEMPLLAAGLGFYDLLAGTHSLGHSRPLSPAGTREALPGVRETGLLGGIAYWDAQFDDARLAIALARAVSDRGGLPLNYFAVEGLLKAGGRVAGLAAVDTESGEHFEIAAKSVINATGVWADGLRRLERADAQALIRPSQGVHVVVDPDFLPGDTALLVPHTDDGRVMFAIPWMGKLLIGTTDTPRDESPIEPLALDSEIDYLLDTASRYLARAPRRDHLRSVFAGLRPLVGARPEQSTRSLSREHLVEVSPGGLVTITGGKWTTYRRMACDAVDAARAAGGLAPAACVTRRLRLPDTALAAAPAAGRRLHPRLSLTDTEVRHAVAQEFARGIEDVLARRHRALFLDAAAAIEVAPEVGRLLAEALGRDTAWIAAEVERFSGVAAAYAVGAGASARTGLQPAHE